MIKKEIFVTTYDAGASEYIAYFILNHLEIMNWHIVLFSNSPACKIFDKLNLNFQKITSDSELIYHLSSSKLSYILYGTGWMKDFSEIISKNHLPHTKTIALIDHWTGYKKRFKKNCLPNYILVMDKLAKKLAQQTFPKTKVLCSHNYFLKNIHVSYSKIKEKPKDSVLFISEPTSEIAKKNIGHEKGYGFTEYEVVENLCEKFDNLLIRLHPADKIDKYNYIINQYGLKKDIIIKPYEEELITSLSKSYLTIGFDGMALYISHSLGIKTVSYMPNSNRKLHIPIANNIKINSLGEI